MTGLRQAAAHAVVQIPTRVPVIFFWLTSVVAIAILMGVFKPLVVLPTVLVITIITWRLIPTPPVPDRRTALAAVGALAWTLIWVVGNAFWASEVLLIERDPGFLTLQGLWFSEHPTAGIPLRSTPAVAAALDGLSTTSDAFWQFGDEMFAQGAKAFPGLIAIPGWVFGLDGVLVGNVLIGGVALLALYDFSRRIVDPVWALLPVLSLSITLPFLYFTRTPFTEPTNLALMFAGLAMLLDAMLHPRAWRFAIAGAMIGATSLSRIDGAAASAGLVLGLGLATAVARTEASRRARLVGLGVATGTSLLMVLGGYLDLRLHSPGYLKDLTTQYTQLMAVLIVSLGASALLVLVGRSRIVRDWVYANRRPIGWTAAMGSLVCLAALASRPLWMEGHRTPPGTGYYRSVEGIQRAAGVPVDGTRSYDEMTISWLASYQGWLAVGAAACGIAMMVLVAIRRPRTALVPILAAVGMPAAIYLIRPAINPDQVWAMRRFLPVVMPTVAVASAWLVGTMASSSSPRIVRAIGAVLGVTVLASPLLAWGSVVKAVEYGGRAEEWQAVCEHVSGSHVLAVRLSGPTILPTLRIMCDSDTLEVRQPVTQEFLSDLRRTWGGRPLMIVSTAGSGIPWDSAALPVRLGTVSVWEHALFVPRGVARVPSEVWIGVVEGDGKVTPVPGADPSVAGLPCADGAQECVRFGAGLGLQQYLVRGWWSMEAWGAWSTDRAVLDVPTDTCGASCEAELTIDVPQADAIVTITRREPGGWSETLRPEPGTRSATVPLDRTVELNRFLIEVDPTYVPAEATGSADQRELGVGLRAVEVRSGGTQGGG